jgi:predicted nuclease of predicted toxin-antitoxin system
MMARLLADECIVGPVVDALRRAGHDVVWARDVCPGVDDDVICAIAMSHNRIIISEDRDFSDLLFHRRLPAIGAVRAKIGELPGSLADKAARITEVITAKGDKLLGHMTVIEPARDRQRPLPEQGP